MFVVLGASGNTGKVVAETLLSQKKNVRVVVHDASKGQAWKEAGADVSIADIEDGAALERAFSGAEGAYVLFPPNFSSTQVRVDNNRRANAVAAAIEVARVPHVVMLSSIGAQQPHDCLFFGPGLEGVGPRLEKDGSTVQVAVSPRLAASEMDILHAVATAGLGIALLPAFQCVEDLRGRRLERVLGDWNAPSVPVHVVYPSGRHLSPKVKTFIDHLQARMTPPPWEVGPVP